MDRPPEIDREAAVEVAMNLFWERGYDGVGVADLLDAMGTTRALLFEAFGSKRDLFLAALALYEVRHVTPGIALLRDGPGSGEERIAAVFEAGAAWARAGDRRGCLMCSTAAGSVATHPEVEASINRQLDAMTAAFASALARTRRFGSAGEAERVCEGARLTLQYVGLRVRGRSGRWLDAAI